MFSGKSAKNSAFLFYIETSIILEERKYLATVHTIIGGRQMTVTRKIFKLITKRFPDINISGMITRYRVTRDNDQQGQ